MVEATPIARPLDDFLEEVVNTVHTAVNQGYRSMNDSPEVTERTLQDCKEVLDTIMAGHVEEWIG